MMAFLLENCETFSVIDFIEKPNLLNFVNMSAMLCPRLQPQPYFPCFQSIN